MKIAVISPHPDDETLGAGGFLLKQKKLGHQIYWINVTNVVEDSHWNKEFVKRRKEQIESICKYYQFDGFYDLNYKPSTLENIDKTDLIASIRECIQKIRPSCVILPNSGDAHSDHRIVFEAGMTCTKVFRYPYIKKILVMEILSETDFNKTGEPFAPNYFVDITEQIDQKIEALRIYDTEMGEPPFPRSVEAVKALALLRGGTAGVHYSEAFRIIKEID